MARVFAVRLRQIEALNICGVAFNLVLEQVCVIIKIPIIEPQTHLTVDFFEGGPSLLHERDDANRLGFDAGLEGCERFRIWAFGHAVVDETEERGSLRLAHAPLIGELQTVSAGTFNSFYLFEAASMADRDRVR